MDIIIAKVLLKLKDDHQFKETCLKNGLRAALDQAGMQLSEEKLKEVETLLKNSDKDFGQDLDSKINK